MPNRVIVTMFSLVCCLLTRAQPLQGQAVFPQSNGKALAGLRSVDAIVDVRTWLSMDGQRERVEANIQSAFELGLRRDGLVVESSAPNYLFCGLKFAQAGGIVAYSWQVEYYDFEATGVHQLMWTSGGIGTIGRSNFDEQDLAKTCVDTFANEWLKWNPRR